MGKIIISENVTLDGVVQDPTAHEGFKHGGWFLQVGSNDREGIYQAALDEALRAEALLVGRRTYEFLLARWPSRTGELADRMNSLPKFVLSSTLEEPDWSNSTVIKGDAVEEAWKLKERLNGEIVVPGSRQLVRMLIENDLVDEVRLMVYPFVLGTGERLFSEMSDKMPLRLITNRTVGDALAYLTYDVPARLSWSRLVVGARRPDPRIEDPSKQLEANAQLRSIECAGDRPGDDQALDPSRASRTARRGSRICCTGSTTPPTGARGTSPRIPATSSGSASG